MSATNETTDPRRAALDAILDAVQAYSNVLAMGDADKAGVVTNVLVAWEESSYGDDGKLYRDAVYTTIGPMATPASSLGLAVYARGRIESDLGL